MLTKFKEKTGKDAEPAAGHGSAAGQVVFAAIEKVGTLDRKAIRDDRWAIEMRTVSGPIKFSLQGWAVDKTLANVQYIGGKPRIVYINVPGKKFPKHSPLQSASIPLTTLGLSV